MKSRPLVSRDGLKTHVLIFDKSDDVNSLLLEFAETNELMGASIAAIGAFSSVTLGYFDRQRRDYRSIPIDEQVEVLSFLGNILRADDKPRLHAHVVVGKADGTAHGGHFLEGQVWPTLEMVVTETPVQLHRTRDSETGLALIDLDLTRTDPRRTG